MAGSILSTGTTHCTVENCGNGIYVRGVCKRHYHKLRRYGDPKGGRSTQRGARLKWIEAIALPYNGNDCLKWPFSCNARGYAVLSVPGWAGHASRYVCTRAHGGPSGLTMQAAHSCGNGHLGCVNPHHLRWVTPKENAADRDDHGTTPKGKIHGNSKLSESDIRSIRSSVGVSQTELAQRFGVHQGTISDILLKKAWAHVV